MNSREMTWGRVVDWSEVVKLLAVLTAGLLVTNLGMPQYVTGPLVNALLILTVLWMGVPQALFVGMITPMGAALSGVLPLPLWVMIPFIALGNAVLVIAFGSLRRTNRWVALVAGSVLKFALLSIAVSALVAHPLSLMIAGKAQSIAIPSLIVNMMTWPQLLTALAGGLIAFGIAYASRRVAR